MNVCPSAPCAVNTTGAVDSTNQFLYFSDSMGVLSFNLATNATARVATMTSVVKGIQVDNQNSLLFIQTAAVGTLPYGPIFAQPMNLATGTANGAYQQVPGASTYANAFGNTIGVSHCNATGCGVCGYAYTPYTPTAVTGTSGASVLPIGAILLASLFFIISF